jgi:hypothetical protein
MYKREGRIHTHETDNILMSATFCALHSWISTIKTAIIESTTPTLTMDSLGDLFVGIPDDDVGS